MGRPVSAPIRLEIESILPYLCDRSQQEEQLKLAVSKKRFERPLVVLIHGPSREADYKFVERMHTVLLPPLLRLDDTRPIVPKGPIFLTNLPNGTLRERFDLLVRELAQHLCGGEKDVQLTDMARSVIEERSPVLVDMAVSVNEKNPLPERKLLETWLEELAKWPDLPFEQALIFVLRFSWEEEEGSWLSSIFKNSSEQQVVRLVKYLAQVPIGDRLGLIDLVRLEKVTKAEVRAWIEKHAAPVLRDARGEEATALEEDLRDRIERYFADSSTKGIPMEKLAKTLRRYLRECLSDGGA